MTADIVQLDIAREFASLPKHSRGREVLARIAELEKRAILRAELATEQAMRDFENSFFVTREEVGL